MGRRKRNHFIPRALLNRFASQSDPERDLYRIWWHVRDADSKEVSTRDVALEKYFYGKEGDVEGQLAKIESRLGGVLGAIDQSTSTIGHEKFLNDYAWVQAIRTRSFRDRFRRTTEKVLRTTADEAHTDDAKSSLLRAADRQIAELLNDQFTPDQLAILQANFGGVSPAQFVAAYIKTEIDSGRLSSVLGEAFRMLAANKGLADGVAKGHKMGLSRMLAKERLSPESFQANWDLVKFDGKNLILGDACIFALNDQSAPHPLNDATNWVVLYFPISPTQCLIGSRTRPEHQLNSAEINVASAKTSVEQFFSSRTGEDVAALKRLIDADATIISETEIAELARSVWRNADTV
jgi:hypothetical protein